MAPAGNGRLPGGSAGPDGGGEQKGDKFMWRRALPMAALGAAGVMMFGGALAQPRDTELKFATPEGRDGDHQTETSVTIKRIGVLEPSSSAYGNMHGFINTSGESFTWGGKRCPNMTISDETVTRLLMAKHAGDAVGIYYREGAITNLPSGVRYKCIVGVIF